YVRHVVALPLARDSRKRRKKVDDILDCALGVAETLPALQDRDADPVLLGDIDAAHWHSGGNALLVLDRIGVDHEPVPVRIRLDEGAMRLDGDAASVADVRLGWSLLQELPGDLPALLVVADVGQDHAILPACGTLPSC